MVLMVDSQHVPERPWGIGRDQKNFKAPATSVAGSENTEAVKNNLYGYSARPSPDPLSSPTSPFATAATPPKARDLQQRLVVAGLHKIDVIPHDEQDALVLLRLGGYRHAHHRYGGKRYQQTEPDVAGHAAVEFAAPEH